jgi:hypothetical protein
MMHHSYDLPVSRILPGWTCDASDVSVAAALSSAEQLPQLAVQSQAVCPQLAVQIQAVCQTMDAAVDVVPLAADQW